MGKVPKSQNKPKEYLYHTFSQIAATTKGSLPHSIVEVIGTLQKQDLMLILLAVALRDSLLGLAPKDFDAVTDARPHEIKGNFGVVVVSLGGVFSWHMCIQVVR